jgi:phospholipase/carboxylesterase
MSELVYRERPAAARPAGLLVLHHGRGTDENDLMPLAEVLDPQRELLVVTPRAPLAPEGAAGHHWYLVPQVGTPDPQTFDAAFEMLAALHDELWERTGIAPARTLLGGFSMGAVMSYALGLGSGRPVPAGILAFSGFLPRVASWEPDLVNRQGLRTFITHGRRDNVISVEFAREAQERLRRGGLDVEYRETDAAHHIDPRELGVAATWLRDTLRAAPDPAA